MIEQTKCDAVMIGRAAATNPWIFSQMVEFRATGSYTQPTDADRHQLLSSYYKEIKLADQPDAVGKMKQFACWFTHGVGNGGELRRTVHAAKTPNEVLEAVEHFFEHSVGRAAAEEAPHPGDASGKDPAHGPSSEHACLETTFGA